MSKSKVSIWGSFIVIVAFIMLYCTKDHYRIPKDPSTDKVENVLEKAIPFGMWIHSFSATDGSLEYSRFILENNPEINAQDPRKPLCDFLDALPGQELVVQHAKNRDKRIEFSVNEHFVIRWGYSGPNLSSGVLMEKASGCEHRLLFKPDQIVVDPVVPEPVPEATVASCLECAIPFGLWTHETGPNYQTPERSTFMINAEVNGYQQEFKELYEFMNSLPTKQIELIHDVNVYDIIEYSHNEFFEIQWTTDYKTIESAVLIENVSGISHDLNIH